MTVRSVTPLLATEDDEHMATHAFDFNEPDPHRSTAQLEALLWRERRHAVQQAFTHAFKGYRLFAWGEDELKPLTRTGRSWLNMGLTAIDALDTALLLDDREAFRTCLRFVETSLNFSANVEANVFETTIRVLGGLLSAHHLSGGEHPVLLERAVEVAERMMPAFDAPSGWPFGVLNLRTGRGGRGPDGVSTAEVGSLQLEFKYLAYLTGDRKYWDVVEKVARMIEALEKQDGLAPILVSAFTGTFSTKYIRLGAHGDSYYEYLAKQYLLTNGTEPTYLAQYRAALEGIKRHILVRSHPSKLLYVRELLDGVGGLYPSDKMDHLACFLPGTIALATTRGHRVTDRASLTWEQREDLWVAEELARTCYEMYHQMPSGLAPEIAIFRAPKGGGDGGVAAVLEGFRAAARVAAPTAAAGGNGTAAPAFVPPTALPVEDGEYELDFGTSRRDRHNLLRPETVESLFVLWRVTGDRKYREWGWRIFRAFEKWAKNDVRLVPPPPRDHMESFFLGETLKYFYLLFSDDDAGLPLDRYVFNTEAHPFPVFEVGEWGAPSVAAVQQRVGTGGKIGAVASRAAGVGGGAMAGGREGRLKPVHHVDPRLSAMKSFRPASRMFQRAEAARPGARTANPAQAVDVLMTNPAQAVDVLITMRAGAGVRAHANDFARP
ncbi:mannosyl-oligosaccharide alpha-1,2-mannosidase [Phlyctochytrium bullatum]|nr:mannosyl-oligosaccharide alpha-1,2-mannosidase [Phlyctochytrium bullatum]